MEFIRKNNMSNQKSCSMQLASTQFKFCSWITDRNTVASNIMITTGPALITESLNSTQSQTLIDLLNLHIDNIKKAEIELIALQTKAAA
jgi:hypothetical protein